LEALNRMTSGGVAPVRVGEKCGYIDKKGELVIKPDYEWDQRSIDMYTTYYTTIGKL